MTDEDVILSTLTVVMRLSDLAKKVDQTKFREIPTILKKTI